MHEASSQEKLLRRHLTNWQVVGNAGVFMQFLEKYINLEQEYTLSGVPYTVF